LKDDVNHFVCQKKKAKEHRLAALASDLHDDVNLTKKKLKKKAKEHRLAAFPGV
jgi:hypothetical protein